MLGLLEPRNFYLRHAGFLSRTSLHKTYFRKSTTLYNRVTLLCLPIRQDSFCKKTYTKGMLPTTIIWQSWGTTAIVPSSRFCETSISNENHTNVVTVAQKFSEKLFSCNVRRNRMQTDWGWKYRFTIHAQPIVTGKREMRLRLMAILQRWVFSDNLYGI